MPPIGKSHPWMLRTTLVAAAVGVVVWVTFPRLSPILLLAAIGLPAAWNLARYRRIPHSTGTWIYLVLAGLAIYLFVNSLWAQEPSRALVSSSAITLYFACAFIGVEALKHAEPRVLRALCIGSCTGAALAATYLLIDSVGSRVIWKAFRMAIITLTLGPPGELGPYGTSQQYVYPYVLNAGFAVFSCLFFPVLLSGRAFVAAEWRRIYVMLATALAVGIVFTSEHGSSKVALVIGAVVFLVGGVSLRLVRTLVLLGWVAATLFVIPITKMLYELNFHHSSLIPISGRARIIIWKNTGSAVADAPFFGVGVGSTRILSGSAEMELIPGFEPEMIGLGPHAHNNFLQAWYELGATGAVFLLVLGVLLINRIASQRVEIQPYLFASFVVTSSLASSTTSIFTLGWVATIILTVLFAWLAVRASIFLQKPSI